MMEAISQKYKTIEVYESGIEFDEEYFNEENPIKLLIHTGNIANWNSLKSRKTQVPANELYSSLKTTIDGWINKKVPSPVHQREIQGWQNCFKEGEDLKNQDERNLVKITVKVLLHKLDTAYLKEAISKALDLLQVNSFDMIILSLPPTESSNLSFKEIISKFWKIMEEFHLAGIATSISSSDLDSDKLEDLMQNAEIKPEVNQVNLTSCCHMPEDLVAYSKAKDIVLHTHGDQPVMLPDESISELMSSVNLKNAWSTNWVLRYAVVVKCRGVIKRKGYIASVESL